MEKVFPAIIDRLHSVKCGTIGVQKYNAKPHVSVNDTEVVDEAKVDGTFCFAGIPQLPRSECLGPIVFNAI